MPSTRVTKKPLSEWRAQLGLSQKELARLAGGMGPNAVARIELGKVDPRVSTLAALTNVLKIGLDDVDMGVVRTPVRLRRRAALAARMTTTAD